MFLFAFRVRLVLQGYRLPGRMRVSEPWISWPVSSEHPVSLLDYFRPTDVHRD